MTARSLPTLPGCGRAASARIEAYRVGGRLHGALDASVYACDDHAIEVVSALYAAGFTPHRLPLDGPKRCGDGYDYLTGRPMAAPELHPDTPAVDDHAPHPPWCAPRAHQGGQTMHSSEPINVVTEDGQTSVYLEASSTVDAPRLIIATWWTPIDPGEPEPDPTRPDDMLFLPLAAGAELAAALTTLIGSALGGAAW